MISKDPACSKYCGLPFVSWDIMMGGVKVYCLLLQSWWILYGSRDQTIVKPVLGTYPKQLAYHSSLSFLRYLLPWQCLGLILAVHSVLSPSDTQGTTEGTEVI